MLEILCERRVSSRLESLSFAQMHGHFVEEAVFEGPRGDEVTD